MDQPLDKPHIVRTPGTCGGKPRIAGTRIRVQDVYVWHELRGHGVERIVADYPHLTLADVHSALAYYFDHSDEIKRDIREDEELVAAMKLRTGPGPLERKLKGLEPARVINSPG